MNLIPSNTPQDIYKQVSDVVIEKMEDIISGELVLDEEKTPYNIQVKLATEWLRVGINRNITKKSVMTLPYGSSRLTCRDSIEDYIHDIQDKEDKMAKIQRRKSSVVHKFNMTNKEDPMHINKAIGFATKMIWDSIDEVVVAARVGMNYIKEVTRKAAKDNLCLIWETPSGFMVEQQIFNTRQQEVYTQLFGKTKFRVSVECSDIDVNRMCSSCAPNVIHSLDAAHLALTIIELSERGVKDVLVIHDSYATQTCNTDTLRTVLLDEFVKMYDADLLLKWVIDLSLYTNYEHKFNKMPQPEMLGLDLNVVRNSEYMFG